MNTTDQIESERRRRSKPLISPLRYPGSKRRLTGYIRQALEINRLKPDLYIEPFAGGASVALQLMQDELVNQVILIDRDPLIAHFWQAVFFDTDWLLKQIETIDVTLDEWFRFKKADPKKSRDYALKCLFLNRTSFSGIMTSEAGPIGGKKQKSPYPIDCRFPRETLMRRVRQAGALRNKVFGIWSVSWDESIKMIREKQHNGQLPDTNLFFYFDPPFFEKAQKLYRFYFASEDHVKLRDYLLDLQDHWLLSYDSAEQVETLYGAAINNGVNGTQRHDVELLYSTSITPGSQPAQEVILSNLKKLPSKTRLWKTAKNRHI